MNDCLVADCENAETFALVGRVVGAEFARVKLFLVAAVSKVLKISATHTVDVVMGVVLILF